MYYFAMSSGEYSDYGVSGFYSADHPITEQEFEEFIAEQYKWEESQLEAMGGTRYIYDGNVDTYTKGRAWLKEIGSKEERFVKLHNLVALDYTELHRS